MEVDGNKPRLLQVREEAGRISVRSARGFQHQQSGHEPQLALGVEQACLLCFLLRCYLISSGSSRSARRWNLISHSGSCREDLSHCAKAPGGASRAVLRRSNEQLTKSQQLQISEFSWESGDSTHYSKSPGEEKHSLIALKSFYFHRRDKA